MSDLEKAAAAWDKAEREGRLVEPTAGPDTPRNSLYNRPVPITIKATVNAKPLTNPFER
jgi:hypothetical protein